MGETVPIPDDMARRFKGNSIHADPDAEYDAIIIGAGIGGLIVANLLALSGVKTLLVEQHYVVGGYCSAFSRKGYQFDAASHFYPLLGNENSMSGKLLKELGVPTTWIKMDPVDHFHFPDGSRYSVPAEFDRYLSELKTMFPEEQKNLDVFFDEVRKLYLLGLLVYFKGNDTQRLDKYRHLTLQDALNRYFVSEKLKLLLTADCPHWGSPPSRISYVFDSMLRLSYFLGNYYPEGGSQTFADDLASQFQMRGGDVFLRAQVNRIMVKKDKVEGIELELGPKNNRRYARIKSPTVVSNADMTQTVTKLVGVEIFGKEYVDRLAGLRKSYPCYLMHLGLKHTSQQELIDVQGYHWRQWDPEDFGTTALKFKLFVPTMFDPKVAPDGNQIVIIQKVMYVDYDSVNDWAAHKEEIDRMVNNSLEELIPDFETRVEVRMSASARTSYGYTLNEGGAMLGWEMSPDQLGVDRPGVAGPLSGLYFTGHWTQPGGGITPVIVSAMSVAELIAN